MHTNRYNIISPYTEALEITLDTENFDNPIIEIEDGSGAIYVKNITGSARLADGSGDMKIREVSGMVTVDDGSGDIDINGVGGLKILETGSGGLKVKNVNGGFEIDS